jgi:hypothetical protein
MTTGITPAGRVRFAGFDVTARSSKWDPVTTGVVLRRLGPASTLRFFTVDEEAVARPMLDRLLAQDGEPRVPVLELIDARLAEDRTDGWRYDDMPHDTQAWKDSLHHLDADALSKHQRHFFELLVGSQKRLLEAIRISQRWHAVRGTRVWSLWMRYACAAFYSHPWAWNEIGFGGPAYPRGYANLGLDKREHWEVPDRNDRDPVNWAARVEAARRAHQCGDCEPGDT